MSMFLSKSCRIFSFFRDKSTFVLKTDPSRYFSVRMSFRNSKAIPRFTNAIFASTAAIGLTLYIAKKRSAINEAANKKLHFSIDHHDFSEAISKCRDLLQRVKDEYGTPGMVIGVSIDDKVIWAEGLGYSDVENRLLCSSDTVLRIASISKSITMTAVAKLWEQGKLDIDKPIQDYVPYFPHKEFNGKPVTITCRQLLSHLGGIRHYDKSGNSSPKKVEVNNEKSKKNDTSEFESKEYYIKDHYNDVKSALDLFKNDPLIASPGSKYHYTTHGWTLISAIIEAVSAEPFTTHMTKLFKTLGMSNTYLDVNDTLIYHRSRNYIKDKKGRLINAPYVDNSYKWAGGGFLSTVTDLLKFGNAMLYSLQYNPDILSSSTNKIVSDVENIQSVNQNMMNKLPDLVSNLSGEQVHPGYLKSETVTTLWTPVTNAAKDSKYGLGWFILPDVKECQYCENKTFVFHTGGAVGASSVLMILPHSNQERKYEKNFAPKGIVVAIITNLQSVALQDTALKISQIFDNELKLSF